MPGALIAATLACAPVPGLDLLQPATAEVLWFGEIHGTNEEPKLFGDIVCDLSARRRPIVVVLERNVAEEPAWSRYLESHGTRQDRRELTSAGPFWANRIQDGRSSQAMLALAERLRQLHSAGGVSAVRMPISDTPPSSAGGYEQSMGDAVARVAAENKGALVPVLTGSAHARKSLIDFGGKPYRSAARYVPGVVTINIRSGPGAAWNCQEQTCGPHPKGGGGVGPRGLVSVPPDDDYDFVASTGSPTTASRPARGDGKPARLDAKL